MCILMTDHRRAGGDVKECSSEQGVYKCTEVYSPRVTLQCVVDGCFLCTWASKQSTEGFIFFFFFWLIIIRFVYSLQGKGEVAARASAL